MINQIGKLSTRATQETNGKYIFPLCRFHRFYNIPRVSAGADRDKDVPGISDGFNLAGKDLLKAVVIGSSG